MTTQQQQPPHKTRRQLKRGNLKIEESHRAATTTTPLTEKGSPMDGLDSRGAARHARIGAGPHVAGGYSYWSAVSTFRREARLAGRTAAPTPAIAATPTKTASVVTGSWEWTATRE